VLHLDLARRRVVCGRLRVLDSGAEVSGTRR